MAVSASPAPGRYPAGVSQERWRHRSGYHHAAKGGGSCGGDRHLRESDQRACCAKSPASASSTISPSNRRQDHRHAPTAIRHVVRRLQSKGARLVSLSPGWRLRPPPVAGAPIASRPSPSGFGVRRAELRHLERTLVPGGLDGIAQRAGQARERSHVEQQRRQQPVVDETEGAAGFGVGPAEGSTQTDVTEPAE